MKRELCGSERQTGLFGAELNLFTLPGMESRFLGRASSSIVTCLRYVNVETKVGRTGHEMAFDMRNSSLTFI